ncbi:MAG: ribokinase [Candidatus Cryptobacteroides sp.]
MSKKIVVVGSSNTDMTIKADRLPAPGETILGGGFQMGPGGKGANQAVAAARLGGNVTFICKVGRDLFGDNAIRGYEADGIDTTHVLRSDKPSGVALILVDGAGENVISVAPGANGDLTPDDIESVRDVIESADYVILQLEIPMESTLAAARIAYNAGACVILNPAPATTLPEELFRYVSIITPNQTEMSLLTGIEDDVPAMVAKLSSMGVETVVMTRGSKGCALYGKGTTELIPALKVDAIDATAAGDTFCGALCVGLGEGLSLKDAALFATRASSITVQRMGAQSSIPYRNELTD